MSGKCRVKHERMEKRGLAGEEQEEGLLQLH